MGKVWCGFNKVQSPILFSWFWWGRGRRKVCHYRTNVNIIFKSMCREFHTTLRFLLNIPRATFLIKYIWLWFWLHTFTYCIFSSNISVRIGIKNRKYKTQVFIFFPKRRGVLFSALPCTHDIFFCENTRRTDIFYESENINCHVFWGAGKSRIKEDFRLKTIHVLSECGSTICAHLSAVTASNSMSGNCHLC